MLEVPLDRSSCCGWISTKSWSRSCSATCSVFFNVYRSQNIKNDVANCCVVLIAQGIFTSLQRWYLHAHDLTCDFGDLMWWYSGNWSSNADSVIERLHSIFVIPHLALDWVSPYLTNGKHYVPMGKLNRMPNMAVLRGRSLVLFFSLSTRHHELSWSGDILLLCWRISAL